MLLSLRSPHPSQFQDFHFFQPTQTKLYNCRKHERSQAFKNKVVRRWHRTKPLKIQWFDARIEVLQPRTSTTLLNHGLQPWTSTMLLNHDIKLLWYVPGRIWDLSEEILTLHAIRYLGYQHDSTMKPAVFHPGKQNSNTNLFISGMSSVLLSCRPW